MTGRARSSELRGVGGLLESLQVGSLAQVPSGNCGTNSETSSYCCGPGRICRSHFKAQRGVPGDVALGNAGRGSLPRRDVREIQEAAATGRLPMAIDFDGSTPWTGVFIYAARDLDFWNEHVVRPAQNFIARGGRYMSQQRAEDVNVPSGSKQALANATSSNPPGPVVPPPPPGLGQCAKRRRVQKEKMAQMESALQAQSGAQRADAGHPKTSASQKGGRVRAQNHAKMDEFMGANTA